MTIVQPQPSPEAASPATGLPALDLVLIEGFTGQTIIGIHASELHCPQPLCIDLQAGLLHARACDTDRIADTIDYAAVRERLHRLLAEHRLQTLEALAEAIAAILIGEFGAAWTRVKVRKPHKFDDVQAVGVQIERRAPRAEHPALRLIATGMVPQ